MRIRIIFLTLSLTLSSNALNAACDAVEGDRFRSVLHRAINTASTAGLHDEGDVTYPALISQIRELQDAETVQRIVECIGDESYTHRLQILADLQLIFEQAATDDDRRLLYEDLGIDRLAASVGLTQAPSPIREGLLQQLQENNRGWNNINVMRGRIRTERQSLDSKIRNLGIALFASQAFLTGGILANLFHYGREFIPDSVTTPTGLLGGALYLTVQSITLVKFAWPRYRQYARERHLQKQREKIVAAIADLIQTYPEQGIEFIFELAKERDADMAELEQAALAALIRVKIPQTTEVLIALAGIALEGGQIDTGVMILHEIISRSQDPLMARLATALTNAVAQKENFEGKLSELKRKFIKRRTLQIVGLGTLGVVGIQVYDPSKILLVKSIALQLAGTVFLRKLFIKVWFHYPERVLKEDLTERRDSLKKAFSELLELSPQDTISFLVGVASASKTHPFIREAAVAAIEQSKHPLAAHGFKQLSLQAQKMRLGQEVVQNFLSAAIERRKRCNEQFANLQWPSKYSAPATHQ